MSIARVIPLVLAVLAAGCGGGDEPKSDEDRAGDVAKQYVATHSNNEEQRCRETLAGGVSATLCDDAGPLASRVNPEVEKVSVDNTGATVTVTGAGNNVLLDVLLVKQSGEWRVRSWRGRLK